MSKNLTRKGLALGASLALGLSGLVAPAAFAADAVNVVLKPSQGTKWNSILQSGVTVHADLNSFDTDTADDAGELVFLVENPGAANVTANFNGRNFANDGAGDTKQITIAQATKATAVAPIDSSGGNNFAQRALTAAAMVFTAGGNADQIVAPAASTEKFIYVSGFFNEDNSGNEDDLANAAVAGQTNALVLTTGETTKNVTLHVTAWLDRDRDGVIDSFEDASARQTIVLYAPSNVTATTAIGSAMTRAADDVVATVNYGLGINNNWVDTATSVVFFKDGVSLPSDDGNGTDGTNTAAGAEGITLPLVVGDATLNASGNIVAQAYTDGTAANVAGIYTARAVYTASNPDVYVGSPSVALDLRDGGNTLVDGIKSSGTSTDNVLYNKDTGANEFLLRTGTKSVTINAQATDGGVDLKASNITVRATFTGRTVTAGNTLTVSGAAGSIAEDDDTIVANAFTDSNGKVSFTVSALLGTKGDAFDVVISVLKSDGTYANDSNSSADVDVVWADAALTTFEAVGGAYVSGANVSLTMNAEDQFGVGMDATTTGALSVYSVAVLGGVETPTTYSNTTVTSGGAVTLTFPNFAAAGTSQILKATLYEGRTAVTDPAALNISVYNTLASSSVTVADSFSTAITYTDYAVGKVATLVAPITSESVKATVTGTVLNANNVGQPGVAVTLSAPGLLFKDGVNYSLDTITTKANEFGSFSVDVFAHTVSTAGHKVSIAADGLTASTLVKTFLPNSINDENLSFSWNFPAQMVKNTTYAVTAKLTDKWGNPINAKDTGGVAGGSDFALSVTGTGSVEVNGVSTTVYRDFSTKGEATVFVRSIKDIAGPGSVSATLGGDSTYNTGSGTSTSTLGTVDASNATDNTDTAWDETLWASTLSVEVDVLDRAPAASATGKVNVGSFNGKLVVYALGLDGAKISWKVAGKWGVANASGDALNRFDRPVGASGVNVLVDIYVNGVKQLSKSVLTR